MAQQRVLALQREGDENSKRKETVICLILTIDLTVVTATVKEDADSVFPSVPDFVIIDLDVVASLRGDDTCSGTHMLHFFISFHHKNCPAVSNLDKLLGQHQNQRGRRIVSTRRHAVFNRQHGRHQCFG